MTDRFDVRPKIPSKNWNDYRPKCKDLFHYFWDLVCHCSSYQHTSLWPSITGRLAQEDLHKSGANNVAIATISAGSSLPVGDLEGMKYAKCRLDSFKKEEQSVLQ
jgi:hypothetical protein